MRSAEPRIYVVGASIAGLFAAWRLAAAGRSVVVYERDGGAIAPRTLIVTPHLRRWWPEFPPEGIRHRITGFDLWAGGVRRTIPLAEPDWVIERAEVRAWLEQLARGAGAEVRRGWAFAGREGDRLVFRRADGAERREAGSVVLAADGAASRVVRAFGLPRPPRLLVLQARVRLPPWAHPERAAVWLVPEDTPYFYWLIPESPLFGVLGLAAALGQPIRRRLDRFLERVGLEPLAYQGGQVAAYRPGLPFRAHREGWTIFPIGDAGGQVKGTTVGGTVTGLWGAAAAAAALLGEGEGLAGGLARELWTHWFLRRLLDRLPGEEYERLLEGLNRRAVGVLGRIPRDAFAGGALRLLLAQPILLWHAVRALLR